MTPLESLVLAKTDEFINSEFLIETDLVGTWYHYTSEENQNAIVATQTFFASFIRSSSDAMEFSLPMSYCRDWICGNSNLLSAHSFPYATFKKFNDTCWNPELRPYFISLSAKNDCAHLSQMYDANLVSLESNPEFEGPNATGLIAKVRYVEEFKDEVFQILERWKTEVFIPCNAQMGNADVGKSFGECFYIFMKVCFILSLVLKQTAFKNENETRIILFSNDPSKDCDLHGSWGLHEDKNSKVGREYLPVKLGAFGFIAKKASFIG